LREEKCRQKIALLPLPKLDNSRIAGWAFDPAIPTHIVIVSVAVFFAIRFIVFAVVADQIPETESVMTGYEI
jgi:hypothetical protein